MASKKAIKFAKKLCKKYKVTHRFTKGYGYYAWAIPSKGHIIVPKGWPDLLFLSGVFHEIAHCLNFRDNKYAKFHREQRNTKKYLRSMALRAEVYTEKRAEKLARKHGILNYHTFYGFDDVSREVIKRTYGL